MIADHKIHCATCGVVLCYSAVEIAGRLWCAACYYDNTAKLSAEPAKQPVERDRS